MPVSFPRKTRGSASRQRCSSVSFGSDGSKAGFALSADDGSLQGGVLQFRPCDFVTTFLQAAGEEPLIDSFVSQDFFEWCGVDSEGRLGLQEDDETLPVISEPATEPSVELDAMVALSAGLVVDPPFPLDQRVETGTVELQVFGNVLSYTLTIENLASTDEVRNGQIRSGRSLGERGRAGDLVWRAHSDGPFMGSSISRRKHAYRIGVRHPR